jgi:hypothetical protein
MAMADCALFIRPTSYCGVTRLRRRCGEVEGGGHERAGVGVFGGGQDPLGGAGLDDLAVLHDEDLVSERAHDARSWLMKR